MNQLEKARAASLDVHDIINQLAEHEVLLPNRDQVQAYLAQHSDLASLLDDMCKRIRCTFGPTVELCLEIYKDPEIDDRYLTLYVRQNSYPSDFVDRIDAMCAEFHAALDAVSGYFLVTTDFRRPRGSHVV
jgi:hypothetical protein